MHGTLFIQMILWTNTVNVVGVFANVVIAGVGEANEY